MNLTTAFNETWSNHTVPDCACTGHPLYWYHRVPCTSTGRSTGTTGPCNPASNSAGPLWLWVDLGVSRTIVSGSVMGYNQYITSFSVCVGKGATGGASGYKTGNTQCFAHTTGTITNGVYFQFTCTQQVTGSYAYTYVATNFLAVTEFKLFGGGSTTPDCISCPT